MSYKERLIDLDRESERSLTDQIVAAFSDAIAAGELEPGAKLPPTRELAETAGINHLTAVRAYRRLRELGLVSSQVGRGTRARGRRRDRMAALRAAGAPREPRRSRDGRDVPPLTGSRPDPALGRL